MAGIGERRGANRVMVARPGRNRPLRRAGVDWKKIFKSILREVGWEGMEWSDVAQERDRWWALLNLVASLRVPQNVGNFFTG